MDFLDFIFVSAPVIKGLLLLIPTYNEESMNADMKEIYNDFMKVKGVPENSGKYDELIAFLTNDKFDFSIYLRSQNWSYLAALKKLKEEIVRFYFNDLKELTKKEKNYADVRDVFVRINEYMLQVMRLRAIINPDFKLSLNKHHQTNITYVTIKSYWINDDGKKERKFAKSIGRLDNYPKAMEKNKTKEDRKAKKGEDTITDENAINDGLDLIQPMMWDYYKKIYPD